MTITKNIKVTNITWDISLGTLEDYTKDSIERGVTNPEAIKGLYDIQRKQIAALPESVDLIVSFGGEDPEIAVLIPDDDAISEYIMNYLAERYGYWTKSFSWEKEDETNDN